MLVVYICYLTIQNINVLMVSPFSSLGPRLDMLNNLLEVTVKVEASSGDLCTVILLELDGRGGEDDEA